MHLGSEFYHKEQEVTSTNNNKENLPCIILSALITLIAMFVSFCYIVPQLIEQIGT